MLISFCYRYKFSIQQIYSITQDNGANFILAGNLLAADQFQLRDSIELVELENYDDIDSSDNEPAHSEDEETESDADVESESENNESDTEEEEDDEDVDAVDGLQVLKCATHTLQLAATDTLKKPAIKKRLKKFRNLVKFLRKPNELTKLKEKQVTLPKKDVEVRWNSSYDMVFSVMKLRSYCEAEKITILNKSDWGFGQKFLRIFKPMKVATTKLQAEQLTLSDFFKIWIDVTLQVKKISETEVIAIALYQNLLDRERKLFENNGALQAALYLDPRFRQVFCKMKPDYFSEAAAQNHLLETFRQLKRVQVRRKIVSLFDFQ